VKVFKFFEQDLKKNLRTCLPVQVESFDPATMTVNVKPLIQGIRVATGGREIQTETGESALVEDYQLPSILDLPVCLFWQGNIGITIPITAGMQGLAIVADRDIRIWKTSRVSSRQASLRKFNINDSFFLPFLPQAIENYNNEAVEVRNGETKLSVGVDGINITGNVNITGNLVVGEVDFLTHTHLYNDNGTPTQTGEPE
jgi:hypothetical protein